jgi:hypothetical protein
MRPGTVLLLLCAASWRLAVAESADQQPSDQDKDLEQIPLSVQHPATDHGAASTQTPGDGRIYLENAFSESSLRDDLLVASPPPAPFHYQERLFLDVRQEWPLADRLQVALSDRLNVRDENDLDFPTHENLINDLRELYLGWQPLDRTYLDVGRINLKNGVALGYNPTDFFRTRSVVEPLSADPTVLREDRLGTLMIHAQELLEGGSLSAAFAPGLYRPTAIYNNLDLPSFNPVLDRTNAHDRLLLKGSLNLTSNFNPEVLFYHEGNQTRFGTNLAEVLGQKVVTYLEWTGGRRSSLIDEALRYGRETGTLPATAPSVLPEIGRESFQNDLSIGASYTTENRITFNLEYHLSQASFTHADWNNWFAAGRNRPAGSPIPDELWYLRDYALDQQLPISRHSAFLRADWVDAFVPNLELTAFVNADVYDGSGLFQIAADYYLSDHWTVGGLVMTNFGSARSDFGSLQQSANVLFKVARYF